jgi:hypothetical protein
MLFGGNAPVEGLINALWMEPFLDGRHPYSRGREITEVGPDATLLPTATATALSHDEDGLRSHLATGPGWTLIALRRRAGAATVRVCAESDELACRILEQAVATAQRALPPAETEIPIGFWHTELCRPSGVRAPRHVDVPTWQAIRANYPEAAVAGLDRLMAVRPDRVTGRLLLLHGPTGTGKTTALRALAHAWREWCQVDTVLDPEALFADSTYLTSVVLGDRQPGDRRWRLLVLEDCDELVGADAKQGSGQALSRLLNLTDGLLGQGLDILVCLTTNENVARLHPAVVRPGRCLAEIEVGPLPQDQARRWLGAGAGDRVGPAGASLAELYALRAEHEADVSTHTPAHPARAATLGS